MPDPTRDDAPPIAPDAAEEMDAHKERQLLTDPIEPTDRRKGPARPPVRGPKQP